jgi:hypothetical protein
VNATIENLNAEMNNEEIIWAATLVIIKVVAVMTAVMTAAMTAATTDATNDAMTDATNEQQAALL